MPKCIKCDWKSNYDEAFGTCGSCGVNRGWFKGKMNGKDGVGCQGCNKGYTEWRCPKCGHTITGNDLISTTSDDVWGCIWLGLAVLFIFTYILARVSS
jgi:hypothetical protein